nr:immunoglobulin light chain junction region [Macaca mulatta]MOV73475.1 immunoglobulin light chain junction region [Macaca mulatta]
DYYCGSYGSGNIFLF